MRIAPLAAYFAEDGYAAVAEQAALSAAVTHAHPDHMTGDALVKELTAAKVMAMEQDVPALQNIKPGGKAHPIDRVLHDGDTVTLGGTTLVAHLTPGHTKGCTTWTLKVQDGGKPYDVVIDRNGELWSGSMLSDRVLRLDPRSGRSIEYLLPRETNIRKVFVDNTTTPVTFWAGNNHGASIVKLEPIDEPSSERAR